MDWKKTGIRKQIIGETCANKYFFFLKKYSHISMGQGIIVSVTFQGKVILHVDERTFYLNTRAEDFLLSALADIDVSVNEIECITNDNRLTILFK